MTQEDRLERLVELVAFLLDTTEPRTREEITWDFRFYEGESGRRRFEDDKRTLTLAGIPIHTEVRPNGATAYTIRRRDYLLPELDLTDDETLALQVALSTVDLEGALWARLAGTKLGLSAGPVPAMAVVPGLALLPVLEGAVRTRSRLRITYNDKVREIDPYAVVAKNGRWYVPAHDSHRDTVVPFHVDRIDPDTVELVAERAFPVPETLDVKAMVPDHAHGMGSAPEIEATVRVDRRFLGVVASEWPDSRSPEPCGDGEMRIRVPVRHADAFCSQVLAFGERVVVEGPADLRRAVVDRLRELAGAGIESPS